MLKVILRRKFWVLETEGFETELDELLTGKGGKIDERSKNKVVAHIARLAERLPLGTEKWRHLGGRVYELKPKPFRVACYVDEPYIVVYAVWRKVGSKKRDRRLIEKALEMESEIARETAPFPESLVLFFEILILKVPPFFIALKLLSKMEIITCSNRIGSSRTLTGFFIPFLIITRIFLLTNSFFSVKNSVTSLTNSVNSTSSKCGFTGLV